MTRPKTIEKTIDTLWLPPNHSFNGNGDPENHCFVAVVAITSPKISDLRPKALIWFLFLLNFGRLFAEVGRRGLPPCESTCRRWRLQVPLSSSVFPSPSNPPPAYLPITLNSVFSSQYSFPWPSNPPPCLHPLVNPNLSKRRKKLFVSFHQGETSWKCFFIR